MRIIDKSGAVYKNTSQYAMLDPSSGHVYQGGETVKVDRNAWLDGQPTMAKLEEPSAVAVPAAKKPSAPVAQKPAAAQKPEDTKPQKQ